jgi:hypothetical protein
MTEISVSLLGLRNPLFSIVNIPEIFPDLSAAACGGHALNWSTQQLHRIRLLDIGSQCPELALVQSKSS